MRPRTRAERVVLKPMRRRHLAQVLTIESQAYTSGWNRSIFVNELFYSPDREYVVAKVGRTVVGYAGVWFTPDEGHLTTIAVHPDYRRLRVATRLLVRVLERTIAQDRDAMTLEVRVSNQAAQTLYERFGFVSHGVRPGYYADNREDALIMWVSGIRSAAYRARLDALLADAGAGPEGR